MDFPSLTLEESLELTIELWEYLAETGKEDKAVALYTLYPGISKLPESECWACEYAKAQREKLGDGFTYCTHCPVWGLPDTCINEESTGRDAEYMLWNYARTVAARKKHAQRVVDRARGRLKKFVAAQKKSA